MAEPMVRITLPRSDWRQIVDDLENMCRMRQEEIQILQHAIVVDLDG